MKKIIPQSAISYGRIDLSTDIGKRAFSPSGRPQEEKVNTHLIDSNPASYVPTVLTLYLSLPETPIRTGAMDHRHARLLQQRAVPLRVVESAFLLASLRRLIRPKDVPPLSPIRSLAYFLPAIEELLADPSPDNYLEYLRLKLNRILTSKDENTLGDHPKAATYDHLKTGHSEGLRHTH